MLDLTNMEAKILKVFIEHYREESNKVSKGISANKLESYGLKAGTFRNHSEYFLNNYFLRPLTLKQEGGNNSKFFQITPLGVLAYLKWQSKSPLSDIWIDHDFFPLLHKYWGELIESFEHVLSEVLTRTLEKIDIRPEFEGVIEGEKIYGGKLDESITIPMGMVDVTIFRKYNKPKVQEIPSKKSWGKSKTYKSLNPEIDDKITERFTFLLFFNLLHSGTSPSAFVNLYMQNCLKLDKESPEQTLDDKKQVLKGFHKRTIENTDKLFAIINNDKKLHSLMKSSISEITDLIANRKSVQSIYDRLN